MPESTESTATTATTATELVFFGDAPLSAYRLAASSLLTYAVSENGRQGPIYMRVVEGRSGTRYSSCGDLAHWLLFRLGVRRPWINRAEYRKPAGHGWSVGLNLNELCSEPVGTCTAAHAARKLTAVPQLEAGDIFLVSNVYGGHAICVTGAEPPQEDGSYTIHTAEYGQPGGLAKTHVVSLRAGGLAFCGASQITHILKLEDALSEPGLVAVDITYLDSAQRAVFAQKIA